MCGLLWRLTLLALSVAGDVRAAGPPGGGHHVLLFVWRTVHGGIEHLPDEPDRIDLIVILACRERQQLGAKRFEPRRMDRHLQTAHRHETANRLRSHGLVMPGWNLAPVCYRVVAILRDMERSRVSGFVFPGWKHGRPLSNMAMSKVVQRMRLDGVTVQGFRSSFRDWCAEQTAYSSEVVENALAHAIRNDVEAAYRRGDLLDKRRQLMAVWEGYCLYRNQP